MITADEALTRLKEGNARYVSGDTQFNPEFIQRGRERLVNGQEPFATVMGCSDSRVPVEIVFDQGLGDLFVIRVAGNVVSPPLTGSVEFAAQAFGSPLVVVLCHTHCGAVQATYDELRNPSANPSSNLSSIIDWVSPSVAELMNTELRNDPEALLRTAVRTNVRVSVKALQQASPMLNTLIQSGDLKIVGAEYSLETGAVEFFA